MTFPWTRWREERAAERAAYLAAIKQVTDASIAQSHALEEIATVISSYLNLLKVDGSPTRQALSEMDEYLLDEQRMQEERERLLQKGYPADLPLDKQVEWVAHQMDFAL